MKRFLFKLIMKLMKSKFSRQQGHRSKATAEFACGSGFCVNRLQIETPCPASWRRNWSLSDWC